MIKIRRSEKKVELTFSLKVPNFEERDLLFSWNCDSEIFAGLLSSEMQSQYYQFLQEIREEYYKLGWRHAKGKRFAKMY